jgi:hypothetical protein
MRTKQMRMTALGTPCEPVRFISAPCQSTIKRHSALCDDKGTPGHDPLVESLINLRAVFGQNTLSDAKSGLSQPYDAFAGVPRVQVNRADNHTLDSSLQYRICAGGSAPGRGAWLESDIQSCASGNTAAEMAKAFNLSVIAARFSMVPPRYDSIVNDQNRSDCRIGTCPTKGFPGLIECRPHELFISIALHLPRHQ